MVSDGVGELDAVTDGEAEDDGVRDNVGVMDVVEDGDADTVDDADSGTKS